MTAVPDRLEDAVGEAEDHEVLDGFLAQIVVDPVDLLFAEPAVQGLVQFRGGLKVAAERLLDDQSGTLLALRLALARKAGGAEMLGDAPVQGRRDCQIEDVTARDAVAGLQFGEPVLEALVQSGIVVIAAEVIESLDERSRRVVGDALGILAKGFAGHLTELFVRILRASAAQKTEMLAQQAALLNLGETGQELAMRQIAGGAEDDHRRGSGSGLGTHDFHRGEGRVNVLDSHCRVLLRVGSGPMLAHDIDASGGPEPLEARGSQVHRF